MHEAAVNRVLDALDGNSIGTFLATLLSNPSYGNHPVRQQFVQEFAELLGFFCSLAYLSPTVTTFCLEQIIKTLTREVRNLTKKETGWHFSARNAQPGPILGFSLSDMARKLEDGAPSLWKILTELLSSDPRHARRRAQPTGEACSTPVSGSGGRSDDLDWDEEDEYWAQVEDMEQGGGSEGPGVNGEAELPSKRQRRAGMRNGALIRIRLVIIMSILMISTNQQCNALASVVGLFCHSTSAPELVIEVLSRAGLSISLTAIHDMISSLSRNSSDGIRRLAKTLLGAFAYDNFDMDFKSWLPTVEKPGSTLQHATSALIFPLEHGVTPDDLKCSAELWKSDPLNPYIPVHERRPRRTWVDCLPPPPPARTAGPDLHTRILAWHFRHALVTHCTGFEHLRDKLGSPETVLQIPVTKTTHVPCRAMDINQSTHDGQAQIIENLLAQANLGNPSDFPGVHDLDDQVLLFHGDLGTGERIQGIRESCSIEQNGSRRLQYVVFVLGLFHLQMACADAIWPMYIEPKELRTDPNGLYQHMCKIRPHDSGRIGSKPGFRLIHDLVHQCAAGRMLDIWRVEVGKRHAPHSSLEKFAASCPSWDAVEALSLDLVSTYVDKPTAKDDDFRNSSLILGRLLLYIELCHAMKHGDIGRAERTFLPWVFVFKEVGKHKYATELVRIMNLLNHVYPPGLARAIRLNWLCNPTGKPDVVYGSSGYTRTFQLIIKQSPLIELFRTVHTLFQDNFHLMHRSVRHAPPDVRSTIKILLEELQKHEAHVYIPDRTTGTKLTDHLREGMYILQTTTGILGDDTGGLDEELQGDEEDEIDLEIEIDDLEVLDEA